MQTYLQHITGFSPSSCHGDLCIIKKNGTAELQLQMESYLKWMKANGLKTVITTCTGTSCYSPKTMPTV